VLFSSHLLYEVEPIADTVAILHDGMIIKQSATETLRSDVKQLVFTAEDYAEQASMLKSLDVLRQRAEVVVTIENAAATIERLIAAGIRHRVIDLNLDDIFAAYVIGKRDRPSPSSPASTLAIPV
jgi:ABC-2 type transport system ATP-binding protein